MGHYVPIYLMNSATHNFFGTTTFRTRDIFVICTGSYKSTPLMDLIRALDDLVLWDSLANGSMIEGQVLELSE